jgi:hypothetical protein
MVKLLKNATFDFKRLTSSKPKKVGDRYYVILKEDRENIIYQMPKLKLSTDFTDDDGVLIDFVDMKTLDVNFIDKIKDIDDVILEYVKQNKEEWFKGKEISDTFLEVGQVNTYKENKENKKEFIIQFKTSNESVHFNHEKEKIQISELKQGQELYVIGQLVGIWFTSTRWGITWKIIQTKNDKTNIKMEMDYLFEEEDYSDIDEDISPPPGV